MFGDHYQQMTDAADRLGCPECGGRIYFASWHDERRYALCRRCCCFLDIFGCRPDSIRVQWTQPWRVAAIIDSMTVSQRNALSALMRGVRLTGGVHGMPTGRRRFNGRPYLRQLEGLSHAKKKTLP